MCFLKLTLWTGTIRESKGLCKILALIQALPVEGLCRIDEADTNGGKNILDLDCGPGGKYSANKFIVIYDDSRIWNVYFGLGLQSKAPSQDSWISMNVQVPNLLDLSAKVAQPFDVTACVW